MSRMTGKFILIVGLASVSALLWPTRLTSAVRQEQLQDSPVIGYRSAGVNDAVTQLQQRINSGEIKLDYSEKNGYLESVLKQLRVPVSSQGLVFSKTSFRLHRISPNNPRAIFFNDEVYVGWV